MVLMSSQNFIIWFGIVGRRQRVFETVSFNGNLPVGVLVRCRQEPVAVMADIKAMFHHVILWWPKGGRRIEVHVFGVPVVPRVL